MFWDCICTPVNQNVRVNKMPVHVRSHSERIFLISSSKLIFRSRYIPRYRSGSITPSFAHVVLSGTVTFRHILIGTITAVFLPCSSYTYWICIRIILCTITTTIHAGIFIFSYCRMYRSEYDSTFVRFNVRLIFIAWERFRHMGSFSSGRNITSGSCDN